MIYITTYVYTLELTTSTEAVCGHTHTLKLIHICTHVMNKIAKIRKKTQYLRPEIELQITLTQYSILYKDTRV